MARPRKIKPDYCLDKDSGRAFVTLNGKRKYLGMHGTQASHDGYDRVIGEWIAAGRQVIADKEDGSATGVTVSTIIAAW